MSMNKCMLMPWSVECLNESVENFYQKYGFYHIDKTNGKSRMFLPMKTVGKLFEVK